MAYVIAQLSGRARQWGTALWDAQSPSWNNFKDLSDDMRRVFDRSKHGHEAARELLHMRQGQRAVPEYPIDFRPSQYPLAGTPMHSLIPS